MLGKEDLKGRTGRSKWFPASQYKKPSTSSHPSGSVKLLADKSVGRFLLLWVCGQVFSDGPRAAPSQRSQSRKEDLEVKWNRLRISGVPLGTSVSVHHYIQSQ